MLNIVNWPQVRASHKATVAEMQYIYRTLTKRPALCWCRGIKKAPCGALSVNKNETNLLGLRCPV